MTRTTSVTAAHSSVHVPDDVSALIGANFPRADLVGAAAATLTARRSWDGREGPIASLRVAPGVVQVRYRDPAKAARTHERNEGGHALVKRDRLVLAEAMVPDRLVDAEAMEAATWRLANAGVSSFAAAEDATAQVEHYLREVDRLRRRADRPAARVVTVWSKKSRANMRRTLASLDYAPLFEGGRVPAMVTLTYPADWKPVAPSSAVCKRQLDELRRRFERAWGVKLRGVWKREFQRRGAPHYHLWMLVPLGRERNGTRGFAQWLSETWAAVVGHTDPVERANHVAAGTGIDYVQGGRITDPKRLAVYFAKHGVFSAKDYQNTAPELWTQDGQSVGRFWGYWGLERAQAEVELTDVEAKAAARTMRRWQRANGNKGQKLVWRKKYSTVVDTSTGEIVTQWRWTKRKAGCWYGASMRGHAGFVLVNDGPSFVATMSRHLHSVREAAQDAEIEALRASQSYARWLDRPYDPDAPERPRRLGNEGVHEFELARENSSRRRRARSANKLDAPPR